jgi:DNA gyrase subunit A
MKLERPDLGQVAPEVRAYIEALEAEIEGRQRKNSTPSHRNARTQTVPADEDLTEYIEENQPAEPPTTLNVITVTLSGLAKRTPRHLYARQNRGGMGVFDLDSPEDSPPGILTIADERQTILIITRTGRAFRLPVSSIVETPVRGRGSSILSKFNLQDEEELAAIVPEQAQGYLALVSQSGMVRLLRHHVFGEYMKPGTALYEYRTFGPLASACWTSGEQELVIATHQGKAIRFSERQIPPHGTLGIRLVRDDAAISITAVNQDSGIFLLGADGRGTIRLMEGFSANKSPGAGGKIAMDTDHLVCALSTDEHQEVFIISRLGKIIRFRLEQIPQKEGVVQGVVCMTLRADEPTAAVMT